MLKKILISFFCLMLFYGMANATSPSEVQAYRLAADRGDAAAEFTLGVLYEKGQGVRQDNAEAVKWYRKAAEQGHLEAKKSLKR